MVILGGDALDRFGVVYGSVAADYGGIAPTERGSMGRKLPALSAVP